jgi:hypothetical protein
MRIAANPDGRRTTVAQWRRNGAPESVQLGPGTCRGYRHRAAGVKRLGRDAMLSVEDGLNRRDIVIGEIERVHAWVSRRLPIKRAITVSVWAGNSPPSRGKYADTYDRALGPLDDTGIVGEGSGDWIELWIPAWADTVSESDLKWLIRSVYAHEWGHVIDSQYRLTERTSFLRRWQGAKRADAAHQRRNQIRLRAMGADSEGEKLGSTWLASTYVQQTRMDHEDFAEAVSMWIAQSGLFSQLAPARQRLLERLAERLDPVGEPVATSVLREAA